MAHILRNPRNGCGLHGALQTVEEIEGVVPVIHANAGCGVINYLANRASGSINGAFGGPSIPGTDAQERHVIFGGASRLREQIKNTVKVVDADLYVILNSCESAMVGDDVDAMTREIAEQGEPVVDTLVAGFNGDSYYGYEHVLADILKKLDTVKSVSSEKKDNLVNIFGIVPKKDIFFNGNLSEIKRILNAAGIEANLFFGIQNGVDELIAASTAAASITFSRWGELPAQILEDKYNIPVIYREALPTGSREIEALLSEINKVIPLDGEKVREFIEKETAYEKYYLRRAIEDIADERVAVRITIVGDEADALRLGRYAKDNLGAEIAAIILTDALSKDMNHLTDNKKILETLAGRVYITQDEKEIKDIIRRSKPEFILGSSLEKEIADRLGVPLLEVSYPIYHKAVLNKSYAGVIGAVAFAEDYVTKIKEFRYKKRKELLALVQST